MASRCLRETGSFSGALLFYSFVQIHSSEVLQEAAELVQRLEPVQSGFSDDIHGLARLANDCIQKSCLVDTQLLRIYVALNGKKFNLTRLKRCCV